MTTKKKPKLFIVLNYTNESTPRDLIHWVTLCNKLISRTETFENVIVWIVGKLSRKSELPFTINPYVKYYLWLDSEDLPQTNPISSSRPEPLSVEEEAIRAKTLLLSRIRDMYYTTGFDFIYHDDVSELVPNMVSFESHCILMSQMENRLADSSGISSIIGNNKSSKWWHSRDPSYNNTSELLKKTGSRVYFPANISLFRHKEPGTYEDLSQTRLVHLILLNGLVHALPYRYLTSYLLFSIFGTIFTNGIHFFSIACLFVFKLMSTLLFGVVIAFWTITKRVIQYSYVRSLTPIRPNRLLDQFALSNIVDVAAIRDANYMLFSLFNINGHRYRTTKAMFFPSVGDFIGESYFWLGTLKNQQMSKVIEIPTIIDPPSDQPHLDELDRYFLTRTLHKKSNRIVMFENKITMDTLRDVPYIYHVDIDNPSKLTFENLRYQFKLIRARSFFSVGQDSPDPVRSIWMYTMAIHGITLVCDLALGFWLVWLFVQRIALFSTLLKLALALLLGCVIYAYLLVLTVIKSGTLGPDPNAWRQSLFAYFIVKATFPVMFPFWILVKNLLGLYINAT